jgi:3-methyl-2-oxobutanoate hydroxymethyltransferase
MTPLQIFARKKREQKPLAMVALSDAPSAQIACEAGIDALLVGDSLGNTALGYDSTLPVTMDDMAHHLGAVVRGVKGSSRPDVPIIADLPFGSYSDPERGVENAVRLMQIGAHAVKIEGTQSGDGFEAGRVFELFKLAGVPVMGHLGFTPQSVLQFESIVQGKTAETALELEEQAQLLVQAGCFAFVLEATTEEVARHITQNSPIATVGIGAGAGCDGQVLVWHDLVGISAKQFKLGRAFAPTREIWTQALHNFQSEVENRTFPTPENGWTMPSEARAEWEKRRAERDEESAGFYEDHFETAKTEPLDEQPF